MNQEPTHTFLTLTPPNVKELKSTQQWTLMLLLVLTLWQTILRSWSWATVWGSIFINLSSCWPFFLLTLDMAEVSQLLSINQAAFTIDAEPTWQGHLHQTRDMVEVMACICGTPIDSGLRNPNTAIQCGYKHCGYVVPAFCQSDLYFTSWPSIVPFSISKWCPKIGIVQTMFNPPSTNFNRGTLKTMSFCEICLS